MSRAQSDFVADYAAKRAAQMERAKMLREMRKESASKMQPNSSAPVSQPQPQPQHHQQYEEPDEYHQPPPPAQNYHQQLQRSSGNYGSGIAPSHQPVYSSPASQVQYPPPMQQHQQQIPATRVSQQLQQPQRQPQQQSRPVASASESVEVTQQDFNRAVAMGIISADQSRQLWATLSTAIGNGEDSFHSPPPPPMVLANHKPSNQATVAGQKPKSTMNYEETPRYSQQQQYTTLDESPQYNANTYAPPRDDNSPPAGVAARKAQQKGSSKPGWNMDTEVQYDDAPQQAPAQTKPAPKTTKQPTQRPRSDWNNDFTEGNVMANEAPAVATRQAPAKKAPAAKRMPPIQQQQPQQYYDEEPDQYSAPPARQPAPAAKAKGVVPMSLQPKTGPASRAGQRQQPPPPPPPESSGPDPDELAEFQRQKEEAVQRLEEELNSANTNEAMVPCRICSRTFREGIIARHQVACQKANKKRKEFDGAAQRADGVEGLAEAQRQAQREAHRDAKRGREKEKPLKAVPKWKQQSAQLQAAMMAARAANAPPGSAAAMAPVPEPVDSRVPCPHCGRKFNEDVAERHIPKCKTTQAKPTMLMRKR